MARIYISSTFRDLVKERQAVASAARRMKQHVICMEDYVAEAELPLDKCVADVRSCDVYIGIFGWRYGFIPAGQDKSITHLEFEAAREKGIPTLIFLTDPQCKQDWPEGSIDDGDGATRIEALRDYFQNQFIVSFFGNPTELSAKAGPALANTLLGITEERQSATRGGRNGPRPELPPILPYLTNRSEQSEQLKQALRTHRENTPRRPLVCIIHGDELECHDRFLERLRLVMMPRLLDLQNSQGSVKEVLLKWPPRNIDASRCQAYLEEKVAEQLSGSELTPRDDLMRVIADFRVPLLVHSRLLTEDWEHDGAAVTDAVLQFWNSFPDQPPEQLLLACLVVKYKRPADDAGFFRKRKIRAMNGKLQKFVESIDDARYPAVPVLTLQKLAAIQQQDVEEWVYTYQDDVATFCDPQELITDIGTLFKRVDLCTAEGHIPMETLGRELKGLLRKHHLGT